MSTVEWKTLGEICNFKKGMMITSKTAEDGTIPVVSGGQKPAFYHNASNRSGETITVAGSGAYAGFVSFWDKPIFVADAFSVSPKNENCLLTKYLFYYLQNVQGAIYNTKTSGGIPHVYSRFIENFIIPLPDVDNQQSIVNQLDTFTTLISRLESELELRQKQYEHYREELLNFEGDAEVEWKTLGEICTIVRGASPRPIQKYLANGTDGVNWIKIGDVESDDKYVTGTKEKITKEGAKKSRFLQKGSFILSNSMSFGRPYILQIEGCIHDGWIAISNYEEWIIDIYLYEIIRSKSIQTFWELKANNGGAMSNLNSEIVKSTLIPIPPKHRQQQIVSQLDTFEQLITALKREIVLRKKQYEYYREKLLTFDE